MKQNEYRHLGHEVLIHKDNHVPAGQWCEEQLGKRWEATSYRSGRWCMFWAGRNNFDKYRFCFATEHDMMWFKLRWS